MRLRLNRIALSSVATALMIACAPASVATSTPHGPMAVSTTAPLTRAQQRWVDKTLDGLTLRERIGQMVMIWTLGDYTNTRDTAYATITRWVEQDKVGGVTMSLGTPIEVAAKLN